MRFVLLLISFLLLYPASSYAQTLQIPEPQIPLFSQDQKLTQPSYDASTNSYSVSWIAQYISGIYGFGVISGTIIAVIVLMYGGIRLTLAAGDAGKISQARDYITGAVVGLILLMGTVILLATLNPDLVSLEGIKFKAPTSYTPTK